MGSILGRPHAIPQASETCTHLQEDDDDPRTAEEFFDALDYSEGLPLPDFDMHLSAERPDDSSVRPLSSTPVKGQQVHGTSWPDVSQIHGAGQVSEDSGLGSSSGTNGGTFQITATPEEKSKTQECQTEPEQHPIQQEKIDENDAAINRYEHELREAQNVIAMLQRQEYQRKELLKWTDGRLTAVEIEKRNWKAEKDADEGRQAERQLIQEQKLEEHEATLRQVRRDLQAARGMISVLENELSDCTKWSEAKLAAFADEKSKLEADNTKYRELHAQQESLLQEKEAVTSRLQQDLEATRSMISGFERHAAYTRWLEEKLSILEAEKAIRDEHSRTCKAEEHQLLQKNLEAKSAAVKQLERQLQQVQGENKQLTACLEQGATTGVLRGNLADAECKRSLESRLVALLREQEAKEDEMDSLRREVSMLRATDEALRGQVSVLEAKWRVAQENVRALGQQKVVFQLQVTKARVEGEELRRQLDTKSTHITELSGQVQKLGKELTRRSARV